jgi:hypothetical protein
MFTYIYDGETHTDTSTAYMVALGMSTDAQESVLNQLAYETHARACAIRAERDKRLAATDFYMLQDAPASPMGVAEYRQALRDITEQEGFPDNVIWPELVLSYVPSK